MASREMTTWDWGLAGFGITLIAILLVMGAVAWVRDMQAERACMRRVAELVNQVKHGELVDGPDAERPR